MIDFIIVALPRSGTTWAANWLTTDQVYCAHDPLWTSHYNDLDERIDREAGDRIKGIACTGLWRWPEWVNSHPARKLILRRDLDAIRESMRKLGFPLPNRADAECLTLLDGRHAPSSALFDVDRAFELWDWLTYSRLDFDRDRHEQLRQMQIEPRFSDLNVDRSVTERLIAEVKQARVQA